MSIPTLHVLYAIQAQGGLIDQITNQDYDQGIEEIIQAGDGKTDAEFIATITQAPVLSFTTVALAKALAIAGYSGEAITSGLDFFLQKVKSGGTREVGANHVKLTIGKGILLPRTARATQGGEASIEYDALAISDNGLNAPIAVATGEALTGSPEETEKFTVGTAKINGTLIEGIQDITIDFGIQEFLQGSDGNAFNTFAGIMERRPSITIRSLDVNLIDVFNTSEITISPTTTIHPGQVGITTGKAEVGFAKLKAFGIREALSAAVHVLFTVNEGRMTIRSIGGAGNDPQAVEFVITPSFDGTNDSLAIATAAVLPSS